MNADRLEHAVRQAFNQLLSDWTSSLLTIGAVSHTVPIGHELRVKVLFE